MSETIKNRIAKAAANALMASAIIPEERELADALIEITQKYGKFNSDDTGVWAGYKSGADNEIADIGVKCANCILYEGGTSCKIIAAEVEPNGYCRFALIPDGVVAKPAEKPTEKMLIDCPVCAVSCGCSVGPCNCPPTCTCGCRSAAVIVKSAKEIPSNCPFCMRGCTCTTGQCLCPSYCSCGCRSAVVIVTAAGDSPCWDGYKQVGMKKGKNGNMVPNCVPKDSSNETETAAELAASRPAPKKDRISGSKTNKPGSADGTKKIKFSARTEATLAKKVKEHNKNAKAGRTATIRMLKAVYRRGAGAFSSSHRPGMARDQWAMARVNAYLRLLRTGRPANPNYKQDNDLLPKSHPKSSNSLSGMTASLVASDELLVSLRDETDYASSEDAIVAFAEFSGLGYEVIPAIKAAWLRGVRDNENPFDRAKELSIMLYDSKDSDLLPVKKIGRLW